MTYLLDTNVCIVYLNGYSEQLKHRFEAADPRQIMLCSVVKAELFFGAMKSQKREKTLKNVENFCSQFNSLNFDDKAAWVYGQIRANLETKGTPIGGNDLMIAAISLAYQMTLVTHNVREFSRIEGLEIIDWER